MSKKQEIWNENQDLDKLGVDRYRHYTELESIKSKDRYVKTIERNSKSSIQRKEWRIKNKTELKNRILKKTYGISVEDYNELLELQYGCCAICGRPQSEFKRILSVDHDHKTGKIRGLLCFSCNQALGLLHDNIQTLKKAIEYLEKQNEN
jgi:hypothetical protein